MRVAATALPLATVLILAGYGSGTDEAISRGNRLVERGEYSAAVESFREESVDEQDPDRSALLAYNTGVALYRDGSYEEARAAFERASLTARDIDLGARSTYNLGNCSVLQAQELSAEGDLQASAQALEAGIMAYRRALELDPGNPRAETNIEVARIILKGVLDEIAQQKAMQELQQRIARALEQLVADQASLNSESAGADTVSGLAGEQSELRARTAQVLGDFQELQELIARVQPQQAEAGPYAQAHPHVQSASDAQGAAVREMEQNKRPAAVENQTTAHAELAEALRLITPPESEDQEDQSQQQDDGEQESPPESEQQQEQKQETPEDEAPQAAMDILREEDENRSRRDLLVAPLAAPGGKDW